MLRAKLQQEEEFQEADILWPDAAQDLKLPQMYYSPHLVGSGGGGEEEYNTDGHRQRREHQQQKASSPVDISRNKKSSATGPTGFSKFGASLAGVGGSSVIIGSHVFVPPHVIVDRRAKRAAAALMMLVVPEGKARAIVMRE